ncbi:GSCOCG00012171001-RA-CDS [Cotesia congregata]|nr:GSCOCG00012171001-RA-CDS [Cotesia congregata]
MKNFPKNPRTLLKTPKKTIIRSVSPGEYFHYGLQQGLVEQLSNINISNLSTKIQINVHIDGLPISKSSKSQLYPILEGIFPRIATPFVIGIYHGLEKPDKCDKYLEDFINEYKILHTKGFQLNTKTFYVTIKAVICDSPARAFVKQTKGHNGY